MHICNRDRDRHTRATRLSKQAKQQTKTNMLSGPASRGGHSGAVPPQITACAPPNENYAPQARTVLRRN